MATPITSTGNVKLHLPHRQQPLNKLFESSQEVHEVFDLPEEEEGIDVETYIL